MKKHSHVYLALHHGFEVFTIMEIKVTQYGVMKPNSNVYLTFHHGFVVFTIMENQCNTEWGYE